MRKRPKLALVAVGVIIMAAAAWEVLRPREPVYEGRPVTAWIKEGYYRDNADAVSRLPDELAAEKKANEAVIAIGTNALPYYLSLLAVKQDSPLKGQICELINRQPWLKFHFTETWPASHHILRWYGAAGIRILGPEAKAAIPTLAKMLAEGDDDQRYWAASTLTAFGLDGIPPLTNDIVGSHDTNRWSPVLVLDAYAKPQNSDSMGRTRTPEEIESAAKILIPFLIQCLKNNDPRVRLTAIEVLGNFGRQPEVVVPAVLDVLKQDRNYPLIFVNLSTATLAEFGPKAKAAVPILLELLNDPNPDHRSDALNALKQIDPEAAARHGEMIDGHIPNR